MLASPAQQSQALITVVWQSHRSSPSILFCIAKRTTAYVCRNPLQCHPISVTVPYRSVCPFHPDSLYITPSKSAADISNALKILLPDRPRITSLLQSQPTLYLLHASDANPKNPCWLTMQYLRDRTLNRSKLTAIMRKQKARKRWEDHVRLR